MADPPANPPAPANPPPEPEPDKGLRQTIADVLGDLFKSGRADVAEGDPATGAQQQAPDVAAQVKAEVGKIRDRERQATERETDRERVTRLEKELAAVTHPQPKEWRRSTRIMGWHRGDDH